MTDQFTRLATALAVVAVAGVTAIISYQHAYELVSSHGESGVTAHLLPFTVDGLICAASMVVLGRWQGCGALGPRCLGRCSRSPGWTRLLTIF